MKKQEGRVSILTLCGVLAIGFTIMLTVKLLPAYMDYWYVQAAVEELKLNPPRESDSNEKVYRQIKRHFRDNSVFDLEPAEVVAIKGRGNRRTYAVDYSITIPLFFNANMLLSFGEHQIEQAESEVLKR